MPLIPQNCIFLCDILCDILKFFGTFYFRKKVYLSPLPFLLCGEGGAWKGMGHIFFSYIARHVPGSTTAQPQTLRKKLSFIDKFEFEIK
jgi:hypothetical protein